MNYVSSPFRLLVIDDDKSLLQGLVRVFTRAGFETLAADNGNQGIELAIDRSPHLILCDIMMPHPDGIEVIKTLSNKTSTSSIPFIFLTARAGEGHIVKGLNLGADDYISKPFTKAELLARVRAVLRRKGITQAEERSKLEGEITSLRTALSNVFERFSVDHAALAEALAHMVALRDSETEEHGRRVVDLSEKISVNLGMAKHEIDQIRLGALLHDIGKVGIPDAILHKPGILTKEERNEMERHPILGFEITKPIGLDQMALDIIRNHHEHWDGHGYPDGLRGESIPWSARIFTVVDVWDALTNDRPYRKAWTQEKAKEFIADQVGYQFDPIIVQEFLNIISKKTDMAKG